MENKREIIEQIDAYLRKEMSATELTQFENELKTNSVLKQELDVHLQINSALEAESNKNLKSFLQGIEKQAAGTTQVAAEDTAIVKDLQSKKKSNWLAIAASLILICGAVGFFLMNGHTVNATSLYSENFSSYPNEYVVIERGDVQNSVEKDIFISYAKEDYAAVIEKIEALTQDTPNEKLDFYKAVSLMAIGENTKAQKLLESLEGKIPGFENQINWYMALNHLKAENLELAQASLNAIVGTENSFRKASAKKILSELKN